MFQRESDGKIHFVIFAPGFVTYYFVLFAPGLEGTQLEWKKVVFLDDFFYRQHRKRSN